MNAYDHVLTARSKGRNTCTDFIKEIFTDFTEMHGDRRFKDDMAVVCGLAYLSDIPCTVIGLEKGKDNNDKQKRNFGSAHPEGYRKALKAYSNGNGKVNVEGYESKDKVAYYFIQDKTAILNLLIAEGSSFDNWTGDDAADVVKVEDNVYSIKMDKDRTVIANFVINP